MTISFSEKATADPAHPIPLLISEYFDPTAEPQIVKKSYTS